MWLPALVILLTVGAILAAGGFAYASTQEGHDAFCAACHSQPESTFFRRSVDAQPVDLASFHTTKGTRCIDCHAGTGVTGRLQAELLGARNTALWFTGLARQPAPLTLPITDAACLKCHPQVTANTGQSNHFHAYLARWQAADPEAGSCVGCHPGHATEGSATNGFQNEIQTLAACDACHAALRVGAPGGQPLTPQPG
jgi:hypothetical protein